MKLETVKGFEISPQQKHLWLLQENEYNSCYRSFCTLKIEGNLDREVLKIALHNIVEQNEILRTSFFSLPGMNVPFQVISDDVLLSINSKDLTDLDIQEKQFEIDKIIHQEKQKNFNFEQNSLLNIYLINLSSSSHFLLISLPALCADFVTLNNLVNEITQAYALGLHGEKLSDEKIQHVVISEWQNELLESEESEIGREYWQKQNISNLFTLKLPFENQAPQKGKFSPQVITREIHADLAARVTAIAHQYDISEETFLLASWQILLWRLVGKSDIVIGTACDGRADEELKAVLGVLTKYLPIHFHLDGGLKFNEFLKGVEQAKLEAYKWQECFTWKEILGTESTVTGLIFLPFHFEFGNEFSDRYIGNTSFSISQQYACIDRFKLKLFCLPKDDFIKTEFHYDSELFSRDDIDNLAEQFQTLLENVISNLEYDIKEIEILSQNEKHKLLFEFNNTKTNYLKDKCIHELFEQQVRRTPNNVAVVFEGQQFTYIELNQRANQLAHYLQDLGVKPDVLVALCVERSLEMVVGLLGILKAGGAYLPLDPAYPKERLAFMLNDAQTPILLTQERLLEKIPEHHSHVVCLDSDWKTIAQENQKNCISQVKGENLAYTIYTSGSTGKPKGVMLSHHAICNHMFWMQTTFPLTEKDKVLQKTPFSFDASVWEFYAPLLVGAQLVIARPGGHQDSSYLIETIIQQKITIIQLVPSLLRMLLEAGGLEKCNSLRNVFCGGEALSVNLQKDFCALVNAGLYNLYGPTEACIDSTFWICNRENDQQIVPIGHPIANAQVYLFDESLKLVPIGVPGELYIGGTGLARGYFNRPDLTAERFIPNPFSNEPSTRLYKTGDLARYLADGSIEYLGRKDYQVKIRGVRIELGEIEAVLEQHTKIRQCVVVPREDVPGNQRLVAYLVPHGEAIPKINELHCFLKQRLPEYMIPSAFVMLDTLPLTESGKVDRRKLPIPETAHRELHQTFVAPRTPIEEILVLIWAEVLGVEQVGVKDNFFTLGGHSLVATQLVSRVRATLSVELPLRSLFEHPTVSELAKFIETMRSLSQSVSAPPILPRTQEAEIPLSFSQQRLWFLEQLDSGDALYNIRAVVRLSGKVNIPALEMSFNEIIARHEILRTNFIVNNGQPIQIIAPTVNLVLPVVELQQLPEIEREVKSQQLAEQEAAYSFNLSNEPLLRVKLLKLGESENILLLTMHHIIADGWSMGVLVQELAALYDAKCNNLPLQLPQLPIQYADVAIWQREWLQGEVQASQLSYWKQQLDGIPALLKLPTDRVRPTIQTFRGANQTLALSQELSKALISLSQRQGVTLFMTLLAAFQILLYHYTSQEDILVGSPIANRNRSETEGLIGCFANTLVLRSRLSDNLTLEELMRQVREVTLGAYAHQDLPFEKVVAELQPERNLSHMPLFQVWFVLQNNPMPPLELSGLTLDLEEINSKTVRYDLKLDLSETQEGIKGIFEYKTDLFDAMTILEMKQKLEILLSLITDKSDLKISHLRQKMNEIYQKQQIVKNQEFQKEHYQKLGKVKRKTVSA